MNWNRLGQSLILAVLYLFLSDVVLAREGSPFGNVSFDALHTGLVSNCLECHNGQFVRWDAFSKKQAPKPGHIPSADGLDCSVCHTPWAITADPDPASPLRTWKGSVVSDRAQLHAEVDAQSCSGCHAPKFRRLEHRPWTMDDAQSSLGHRHIPNVGKRDCGICHGATVAGVNLQPQSAFAAWTGAVMDHGGISKKCRACHDGTLASGIEQFPEHVAIGKQSCERCHQSSANGNNGAEPFQSWVGGTFGHKGIRKNCADCHDGDKAHGQNGPDGSYSHFPTLMADGATPAPCERCHAGSIKKRFGDWKSGVMGEAQHAAIGVNYRKGGWSRSDCGACHDPGHWTYSPLEDRAAPVGIADAPFPPDWPGRKNIEGSGPSHIDANLAPNCGDCHTSAKTFRKWNMTHTPQLLAGSGGNGGCAGCHAGIIAKGTVNAPTPPGHIPLDQPSGNPSVKNAACGNCHVDPDRKFKPARMRHLAAEIADQCVLCHDGSFRKVGALGKPKKHIPTDEACERCHSAAKADEQNGFTGAPMDHDKIIRDGQRCESCHDAKKKLAKGMPRDHVPTDADCVACHQNAVIAEFPFVAPDWSGATMDHVKAGVISADGSQVSVPCANCHDGASHAGQTVIGRPDKKADGNLHPKQGACENCHRDVTMPGGFKVAVQYDHTGRNGGCAEAGCHDNKAAQGRDANHIPNPASAADAGCESCHQQAMTARNGWPKPVSWANTGELDHEALGVTGNCERCHNAKYAAEPYRAYAMPAVGNWPKEAGSTGSDHIPNPGDLSCERCHQGFTSFAGARMDHAGVTVTGSGLNAKAAPPCARCHTGTTQNNMLIVGQINDPQNQKHHLDRNAGDGCQRCHTTESFGSAMDHSQLPIPNSQPPRTGVVLGTDRCDGCHDGKQEGVTGPLTNHIPPNTSVGVSGASLGLLPDADCYACHQATVTASWPTPVSFRDGTMDHLKLNVTGQCSVCHDDTGSYGSSGALGKNAVAGHIPTTASCEACHAASSEEDFTAFDRIKTVQGSAMNHAAVVNDPCSTCHKETDTRFANQTVVGKPLGHLPTRLDCGNSGCHRNKARGDFGDFAGTVLNHEAAGIVERCADCHSGESWAGNQSPLGKGAAANHVATSQDCSQAGCHDRARDAAHACGSGTAGAYKCWSDGLYPHTAKTGCAGCHSGTGALGATLLSGGHIPLGSNKTCESCHRTSLVGATAPFTTVAWSGAAMDHGLVDTAKCGGCHGATFQQPPNYRPTGIADAPGHVPVRAGADCSDCHTSTVSFKGAAMDHAGITGGCASCHGPGSAYVRAGTVKTTVPQGHINIVSNASVFDLPTNTPSTVAYPASGGACENCHSTSNFTTFGIDPESGVATYAMSHEKLGVTRGCADCHRTADTTFVNQVVKGKPATHIADGRGQPVHSMNLAADPPCEVCHDPARFTNFAGTATNHPAADLSQGCEVCHADGGNWYGTKPQTPASFKDAGGKPLHIATSLPCKTCHQKAVDSGYSSWAGGTWDHSFAGAPTGCADCHDGSKATGLTGPSKNFNHVPLPPGTGCESCHQASWSGGRHYDSFAGGVFDHENPSWKSSFVSGKCTTCHVAAYATSGARAMPATGSWPKAVNSSGTDHILNPGNLSCERCHLRFTTFAGAQMDHTGITISGTSPNLTSSFPCATCHTGTTQNHMRIVGKIDDPNHQKDHIDSGAPDTCESCHTTQSFGAARDHAAMVPPVVPGTTRCDSCHDGMQAGVSGPMANHIPPNVSKPVAGANLGLLPTADCYACHQSTVTTSWPTPVSFRNGDMDHIGLKITGQCALCHDETGSYGSSGALGKNAVANHIPTAAACESCHAFSAEADFTSFSKLRIVQGSPMNHGTVAAGTACNTCHKDSDTEFANQIVRGKPSNHIPTTLDCGNAGCHQNKAKAAAGDVNAYASFAGTVLDHAAAGATSDCAGCHNGTTYAGGQVPDSKSAVVNHIATTADCSQSGCHDQAKSATHACASGVAGAYKCWSDGRYPHASRTGCSTCHAGTGVYGATLRTAAHIPVLATSSCELCHTAALTGAAAPYTAGAWSGAVMNHGGADVAECSDCHGATFQQPPNYRPKDTGADPNHIPLQAGQDCSLCHKDTASFATVTMSHNGINSGCAACHGAGTRYVKAGTVKSTVPAGHINVAANASVFDIATNTLATVPYDAAGGACENCHSTTDFTSFASYVMNHDKLGVSRGCADCHKATDTGFVNQVVKGKPANHIPDGKASAIHSKTLVADPPCESCHNPITFTNFSGTATNHAAADISQGCEVCHANGKSWFGTAQLSPNSYKDGSGNVLHIDTAQPCKDCHQKAIDSGYSSWSGGTWNHSFSGAPSGCAGCHDGVQATGMTGPAKTFAHIPLPTATTGCETCHQASWSGGRNYDSFQGGVFNHENPTWKASFVDGKCTTCHVATYATSGARAMPAIGSWPKAGNSSGTSHIPNPGDLSCERCHLNFTSFVAATMDHSGFTVTGSGQSSVSSYPCATCHTGTTQNNMRIVGKIDDPNNQQDHIANSAPETCEVCHTTQSFGAAKDHAAMVPPVVPGTTRCDGCHDGKHAGISGPMVNHIPPNVNVTVSGADLGSLPTADCYACHEATVISSWPTPVSFRNGDMDHVGLKVTGQCALCHDETGSYGSSGALGKNAVANHIPTAAACENCHAFGVEADFTSFARLRVVQGSSMNHGTLAAGTACSTCHKDSDTEFANQIVKGKPSNHIPTALDCANAGCHQNKAKAAAGDANAYASFGATVLDHAAAGATGNCASCHNGAGYAGGQNPDSKTSVANHVATAADCSQAGCHDQAKSATHACASGATGAYKCWSEGRYPHAAKTGCASCHAGAGAYGATLRTAAHIPVLSNSSCELCHGSALTGAAAPYATGAWSGAVMNHTGADTTQCSDCHGATFQQPANYRPTDTSAAKNAAGTPNHVPLQAGQDCSLCHKDTASFATVAMSHSGIASGCAACHGASTQYAKDGVAKTVAAGHINITSNPSVFDIVGNNLSTVSYPASGEACENCHSTSDFTSFASYTMDHAKLGVSQGCANCHKGSGDTLFVNQTVKGKPLKPAVALDHIPDGKASPIHSKALVADPPCEACHDPIRFASFGATATRHPAADISQGCEVCHANGKSWFGTTQLSPNSFRDASGTVLHIETSLPCKDCHQKAIDSNFTAWSGATWIHSFSGAPAGCADCHDGVRATGTGGPSKAFAHIPLPANTGCETCHQASWVTGRNYDSFAGGVFNHENAAWKSSFVDGKCATCHGGTHTTSGAPGMPATGTWPKTPGSTGTSHIPNPGDLTCDRCHGGFTSFAGAAMDHTGFTVTGTGQNAVSSYPCATCHTGTTQNNMRIVGKIDDPNNQQDHLSTEPPAPDTCERCHTTQSFGEAKDHSTFVPPVTPGTIRCDTCHDGEHAGVTGPMANHIPPNINVSVSGAELGGLPTADCYACHQATVTAAWPTPISFRDGKLDHIALNITGQCSVCHDETGTYGSSGALGKNAVTNHIPTTASCESCHGSSVQDDFSSFVRVKVVEGSRMNHGVIGTAACSNCHKETDTRFANQTVKGKPANHLPTTLDCDSSGCHGNKAKADFSNFANTQFDHAAANVASCAGCHTGASYAGNQVPLGKSALANHVATTADCSQSGCHDQAKSATHACASGVTGAYQCWSDGQYPHTSKTGCSSCHAGTGAAGATLLTAAHIPVKTTSSCETCHKTALSGATAPFTEGVWTGSAMDHAAVDTARCANCHGATFQQPANYQPTDQTAAKDTSGAANGHIPLQAGQDCKACHTDTVSFANWTMSHAGITSNCSSCHSDATQYVGKAGAKVTTKPAGHINVVSNASVYDLAANPATLTPVAYPASGGACENCHSTTNFSSFGTDPASGLPTYTMSHEKLGVTQGCADCHKATGDTPFAGQVVKGKPLKPAAALDHIPDGKSSAIHSRSLNYDPPCEVCHSAVKFTNFTGTATNHPASDITQGCETCHGNGKSWFGTSPKSPNSYKDGSGTVLHVDTTEPCLNCHQKAVDSGYTAWSGGTWTHSFSGAPSGCASCHDGTKATGTSGPSKTFAHIPLPSGAGCESCHQASWSGARNYDSFAGGQFDHENPAWKAGFVTGKCASCHISTYATSGAVAMPAIGSWPKAVNSTGSEHIPNPGNLACEKCHKTFTSFTGAQMDHSGITVTGTGSGATASYACANCHVGTTQNSVLIVGQVNDTNYPNDSYHLKAGVRQTQCQQCHTTTTFGGANDHQRDTSGNPNAPYANSSVFNNLTTVTPPCGSCHAESGGAGWKMANHIPPNVSVKPTAANTPGLGQAIDADCYRCHRSTTQATPWPVPVSFSGGSFDHIGLGVTGNCNVCHDATGTYYASSNAQGMNAVANHIPTTASCENCHKSAVAADFADFAQIKTVQGSPMNHGVIGTAACTSCHKNSDTLFANQTVKGKPANHMPTTLDCGTSGCHDNKAKAAAGDANAYANFANTRLDHAKASLTANCASCHSGATWAGSQTPKSKTSITGHVTTTQDCSASGCHAKAVSGRSAATSACASAFGAYQCWGDGLYPHTETTGCSSCHTGSGAYGATVQTGGHIPVKAGTSCELCHLVSVNGSTSPVIAKYTVWSSAVIQHSGVDTASCVTCHGDSNVFSQPAGYQPTNKASFFKGVGVARTPVTPAHVATTADCRTCHSASTTSYVDWKNAGYDHQGVTTGCGNSGCHNGSNGPPRAGKSATDPKHLTTTQDCSLCHLASFGSGANAYQAWGGATMKHTGINFTSQPCNSCHADKTVATPPTYRFQGPTPPGYIEPTTTAGSSSHQATGGADCQSCHSASLVDFASWGGAGFDHKDSGTPSGYKTSGCNASGCHDGSNGPPKAGKSATSPVHVPTTADCAQCHTNAFYPSAKMYTAAGWAGTKFNHTTTTARCDTCHGTSATYQGGVAPKTTASALPNHVPISQLTAAQNNCVVCHARPSAEQTSGYYSAWSGGIMYHTTITGSCKTCHGGGTTYAGNQPKTTLSVPSLTHVSITPVTTDCSSCHAASIPPDNGASPVTYKPWSGGKFHNRSGVTNVTTGCATCHTASGTTILGATGMVFKDPANGAGHIPNPANLSCERCHTGNALLFTTWSGTGIGMSHSGITTNCKSCHNGTLAMGAPPSNPGNSARFPSVASPVHTSLSYVNNTACEVCHYNGGTITAYSGSTLNASLWKTKQVGWNTSTRKFVTLWAQPTTTTTPPGIAPQCGAWHQGTSPLADTSCITCHGAATVASGTASVLINPWMGKGPKSNSAGHEGGGSCLTGCHEHSRPSATSCSGF